MPEYHERPQRSQGDAVLAWLEGRQTAGADVKAAPLQITPGSVDRRVCVTFLDLSFPGGLSPLGRVLWVTDGVSNAYFGWSGDNDLLSRRLSSADVIFVGGAGNTVTFTLQNPSTEVNDWLNAGWIEL